MSCNFFVHNDPVGGAKFISGTTCSGTEAYYYLTYGQSVCMNTDLAFENLCGLVLSGSCFAVTPTPSTTPLSYCIVSASTYSYQPFECPFDGTIDFDVYGKLSIYANLGGAPVSTHPPLTALLSNGTDFVNLTIQENQSSNQFVYLKSNFEYTGGTCENVIYPDWYVVTGSSVICEFVTPTPTRTPTQTPTNTVTPTVTPTNTATPTNTGTGTPTPTPTIDCSFSGSATYVDCSFEGAAVYIAVTPTVTPTQTQTPTPSITQTATNTPTTTTTLTATPSATPPPPSGTTEAQTYLRAVVDAGGTGITPTVSACTITLFEQIMSNNLWDKIQAFYPMLGGNASGCKFNGKNPTDSDSAYRLQFNGGWTYGISGVTSNGTTAYADTFLSATSVNSLSNHLGVYMRNNTTTSSKTWIGASNPLGQYFVMGTDGTPKFIFGNKSYGPTTSSGSPTPAGFNIISSLSTISNKHFYNGVLKFTATQNKFDLIPASVFIGALNNNGSTIQYYANTYSFATIGSGLTDTEAINLTNIINTFNACLSRNTYPSITQTPTQSPTVTATQTLTASNTPTPTITPTQTITQTNTPTKSPLPTYYYYEMHQFATSACLSFSTSQVRSTSLLTTGISAFYCNTSTGVKYRLNSTIAPGSYTILNTSAWLGPYTSCSTMPCP